MFRLFFERRSRKQIANKTLEEAGAVIAPAFLVIAGTDLDGITEVTWLCVE